MLRPEALLVDGECTAHRRLGLVQPVRAWSIPARLLRLLATLGCSGPKLFSSIASARRISGSAFAARFVALNSSARLLRSRRPWDGPVQSSSRRSPAPAASAARPRVSRFVAWSNCARLLRRMATFGMVWAVALLVDRQRPAHQRLGLRQPVRGLEQHRQVVEVSWRRWGGRGRGSSRRSPAPAASAARPRPAGSWPGATAPGC